MQNKTRETKRLAFFSYVFTEEKMSRAMARPEEGEEHKAILYKYLTDNSDVEGRLIPRE
jgi:hypothetical protein